jgi:hypothetical protein
MNPMAIDAGWHIRIVFVGQSGAMDALLVFLVYGVVALRAGLGNGRPSLGQSLPGLRVNPGLDCVRRVAICANRSRELAFSHCFGMNTILRLIKLGNMAALADLVEL